MVEIEKTFLPQRRKGAKKSRKEETWLLFASSFAPLREKVFLLRRISSRAGGGAFFNLCPRIAQADRPIEHQLVVRVAVNAVITKALKLILSPGCCVSYTRFDFAIGYYLQ